MTLETIKNADLNTIEQRIIQIRSELTNPDADLDALDTEISALESRRAEIKQQADSRQALLTRAGNFGVSVESFSDVSSSERTYGVDSAEYRNAWLKNISGRKLDSVEQRILTTGIAGNESGEATSIEGQNLLVPTQILDNIWNLVTGQHSIMDDITIYRTGTVIEIIKHTSGSGAEITTEGNAPKEEENTFAKVTLAGKDFSKYVDLTYAMQNMSIKALQPYIENEIGEAIGEIIAQDVVDTIKNSVAAGNKIVAASPTFSDITKAFGALKRASNVAIYATRSTIYNKLIGMVGTDKKPIFQQYPTEKAVGTILGAPVKVEDAVADGTILIGDGKKFTFNMIQDIMIETDRDIKKHVTTHSGYARGEGALVDDTAFSVISAE